MEFGRIVLQAPRPSSHVIILGSLHVDQFSE
jgi:hypothetical protein